MAQSTWMRNPEDGEDYPADTPVDVARLRALGYVDSPNSSRPAPGFPRPTVGVQKPAPDNA